MPSWVSILNASYIYNICNIGLVIVMHLQSIIVQSAVVQSTSVHGKEHHGTVRSMEISRLPFHAFCNHFFSFKKTQFKMNKNSINQELVPEYTIHNQNTLTAVHVSRESSI